MATLKIFIKKAFSLDIRSIALFRICISFFFILDLILRIGDLKSHYTDLGIFPRFLATVYPSNFWPSIHFFDGTNLGQALVMIAGICLGIGLLFGYKTRLTAFSGWIFLISLHNRNFLVHYGADSVILCMVFWLIFLPENESKIKEGEASKLYFSGATIAIIFQIISIYFFSALSKNHADWLETGIASYNALMAEHLSTSYAAYALNFPKLLITSTFIVHNWELLAPFLVIIPFRQAAWRTFSIFGFILMHLSFAIFIDMGLFSWII